MVVKMVSCTGLEGLPRVPWYPSTRNVVPLVPFGPNDVTLRRFRFSEEECVPCDLDHVSAYSLQLINFPAYPCVMFPEIKFYVRPWLGRDILMCSPHSVAVYLVPFV